MHVHSYSLLTRRKPGHVTPVFPPPQGRRTEEKKIRKKYLEIFVLLILERFLLLSLVKRHREFKKRIMTGRVKFIMF